MSMGLVCRIAAIALLAMSWVAPAMGQDYEAARREMVQQAVAGAGVQDARVLEAMRETPRHEFVDVRYRPQAYYDMALPIGAQQTISSPFIVAYMTEALDPQPSDRVLEIGTGSGYQTAILSPLVRDVYSIEIVPSLGEKAARTLRRLGYKNVFTKIGDGFQGWAEHAPFDKIIVTCSPEDVPQPLIEQLREGGLMVIPVGERYQQTLYLFRKVEGELAKEALRPTLFVPMTGRAEANRDIQPDPARPQVSNGDFEQQDDDLGEEFVPGWYYGRQFRPVIDSTAPSGGRYIEFKNEEAGRSAHLLQGLAIDGSQVRRLELSAWVRTDGVFPGQKPEELPRVALSFFDAQRAPLGHYWLGPFHGTQPWRQVKQQFRVPPDAREAILRIGLFGATGAASMDQVEIRVVD